MINGKRIKVRRAELDLSQKALADAAGIARTSMNYIERGHQEPSAATLAKLARVLELPMSALMLEESETPKEIAALRSLDPAQRRLVVKMIALRGELPLMEDLKELARFKRVVSSAGLDPDSAEFRRWYKTADLDEVREELLPETEDTLMPA